MELQAITAEVLKEKPQIILGLMWIMARLMESQVTIHSWAQDTAKKSGLMDSEIRGGSVLIQ